VPRQASFDGGYASGANLAAAKALGVKDVCFSKKRGLKITEMVRSTWVYRRLRDFRAGVEGMISYLKRAFGLDRCTWRGQLSFGSYVWGSVVSANLLTLARHLLN
jgi:IS5 family transposase